MLHSEKQDMLFSEAISTIDAGDESTLKYGLTANPGLVNERLENPDAWLSSHIKEAISDRFAGNPLCTGKLHVNISLIINIIIDDIKQKTLDSVLLQPGYTLGIISSCRMPGAGRAQLHITDIPLKPGATPAGSIEALAHGNPGTAKRLTRRGAKPISAVAVSLERMNDLSHLSKESATGNSKVALAAATSLARGEVIEEEKYRVSSKKIAAIAA
ncbi:MAG: hypothetical protein ABI416_02140 [Ginsengibacter sp.]